MTPVSEPHAWPAHSPEEQARDNVDVARSRLGLLVQQLKGDDLEPWRARLLSAVGLLDSLTDQISDGAVEVQPAPVARPVSGRAVVPTLLPTTVVPSTAGENTRAWIARVLPNMLRNQRRS